MYLRIFSATCLLALAACSDADEAASMAAAPGDQMLVCAIGPDSEFTESCTLQKVESEGKDVFRVNHPRGGFRLFDLAEDGTGLVPYDGAEGAVNRLDGDVLEVSVGDDRYRFPARPNQGADAE